MAYLKPPWFTRKVFNRVALATGLAGTQTLAVERRSSAGRQTIPVIPVDVGGITYVVSTRGESHWVQNVRGTGAVTLGATSYRATEVPVDQCAPILEAYRAKAGKTVEGYWQKLPEPADHPVFALARA